MGAPKTPEPDQVVAGWQAHGGGKWRLQVTEVLILALLSRLRQDGESEVQRLERVYSDMEAAWGKDFNLHTLQRKVGRLDCH